MSTDYLTFANENGESTDNITPSYYYSLDAHNYGNGGFAITDPMTWGEGLGNAGKLIVTSLASGLNSFYNTGVAVGNFFGGEFEENDLEATLSSIDDDLGKYYSENRDTADLIGFVVTSFIPGVGGVKLLNAAPRMLKVAESGMIGANMSKSTGLLQPTIDKYLTLAAKDIATSRATFNAINGNTVKALGAGFGQAALETTAFEIAVAATMFKSPVLEDQDIGDLVKNIAVGTVLGGGIIGAFSGASLLGKIKSVKVEADLAEKPYTFITETAGLSPSDKIIQRFIDIDNTPGVEAASEYAEKFNRLKSDKLTKLENLYRTDINSMAAKNDSELGNFLADNLKLKGSETVRNSFLGSTQIGRLVDKLDAEKEIDRILKRGTEAEVKKLKREGPDSKIGYVSLRGENAGQTYFDAPKLSSLADTVKSESDVIAKVKQYKFKEKELFDVTKVLDDHLAVEARYIWADRFAKVSNGMKIHEFDIPLLEKAVAENLDNITIVSQKGDKTYEYAVSSVDDVLNETIRAKQEAAYNLVKQAKTTDFAAKVTNSKVSRLEGVASNNDLEDYFARQDYNRKYTDKQIEIGNWSANKGIIDTYTKPSFMKIAYSTKELNQIAAFEMDAAAYLSAKGKLYEGEIDNVLAETIGPLADNLYRPGADVLLGANREGAGAGLFKFANGNYGTLASWSESIGNTTSQIIKQAREETKAALDSVAIKLANNTEAAIEFEAINNKIARTSEHYVLADDGVSLIARKVRDYQAAIKEGKRDVEYPKLQEGAPEKISIDNADTLEAIKAHISTNGKRVKKETTLRNVQGYTNSKKPDTFYPIRPNPKDYKFFAFVRDPKVTGSGHVSMIHANTAQDLENLIKRVPSEFDVITSKQSEEFFKARNEYKYDRTLHENYIDSALQRKGVNSAFFQKTDPVKIAQDWMEDQLTRDDVISRELVSAKFEKEFAELRRLGETYTDLSRSSYSGNIKSLENVIKNPYVDYVKTALNITKLSEYPFISGLNNLLDSAFSSFTKVVDDIMGGATSEKDLEKVNAALDKYGVKGAYYDAALQVHANHSAPRGALSKYIRDANSIISALVLRLDPLNALNNAIGSNVLLGTETQYVLKALRNADPAAAGKLSELLEIAAQNGTDVKVKSAGKLIFNSQKRFFSEEAAGLLAEYKKNGWITDISTQLKTVLDDLSLQGAETEQILSSKISSAFRKVKEMGKTVADTGEKWTGNRVAEEFNRFVAADVMKQITDVGVEAGVISSKEQLSFINTFVNRTQGNYLASQRPLIFQGPIGQAIGLFQTYQFNLLQQMFRYAAEGTKKDLGVLLGLQSSIYGMNGLPAFNAINTHIVGSASGNPEHRDFYDATYGAVGKSMGDMLLYGIPSNLLQTNLYTRGDINPRNPTVIPVNPADIAFVNAFTRVASNVIETGKKIGMGADLDTTILQAIEHNGLNRPLAGIAQIATALTNDELKSYSTSSKGNLVYANDLVSLANVSRLVGGKPLDEAVVNDALFRIKAYQAVDRGRKEILSEALKTTVIGGGQPTPEQVEGFLESYVAAGGKPREFNKWMIANMKAANSSQANKIIENLNSPYSQSLQTIMGGGDIYENYNLTQ